MGITLAMTLANLHSCHHCHSASSCCWLSMSLMLFPSFHWLPSRWGMAINFVAPRVVEPLRSSWSTCRPGGGGTDCRCGGTILICTMVVVGIVVQWCPECCGRLYQQAGATQMHCDCTDSPSIINDWKPTGSMAVNVRMLGRVRTHLFEAQRPARQSN